MSLEQYSTHGMILLSRNEPVVHDDAYNRILPGDILEK